MTRAGASDPFFKQVARTCFGGPRSLITSVFSRRGDTKRRGPPKQVRAIPFPQKKPRMLRAPRPG